MFVFIIEDLKEHGIDIKNCRYYTKRSIPLSTILLSNSNGARTIIHSNKNLPHIKFEDFDKCDLNEYNWIHFEARSVLETTQMMLKIRDFNEMKPDEEKIKISLELEKKRDENLLLIKFVDVAILGRDFAESDILGCTDKKKAIYKLKQLTQDDEQYKNENCTLICPWGKDGACALDRQGNYFESPIFPCEKTVDTLGAGDTFTGGLLYSLMNDFVDVQQAIIMGCRVAGFKCGFYGYDCIKEFSLK